MPLTCNTTLKSSPTFRVKRCLRARLKNLRSEAVNVTITNAVADKHAAESVVRQLLCRYARHLPDCVALVLSSLKGRIVRDIQVSRQSLEHSRWNSRG